MTGSATIIRGDALHLPLGDNTVDLICTSPPYFGLRSYQDGGEHYGGQVGSEATPVEFVDALIAATREMVRVLKPDGNLWINLGDKMSGKSLIGVPWRYALRCIDELGLILRAEVIWDKPNGLPESVQDRVRRSHEVWFHFVTQPRYYSAVDEIREPAAHAADWDRLGYATPDRALRPRNGGDHSTVGEKYAMGFNPLGKLPGSVWRIPTQPLKVPAYLGVDHFAAFPMEWPRRITKAWSPAAVCTVCGEGRRPVADKTSVTITGYACACTDPTAPTTPGLILDPFGGTGTTALVAKALGRNAITVDMSGDYCRLAEWRTSDPDQLAKAAQVEKPAAQVEGQTALFDVDGLP